MVTEELVTEELATEELAAEELEDDSPEIEARIISYNGINYLLDHDSNIYHHDSFEHIGTFHNDIITFF